MAVHSQQKLATSAMRDGVANLINDAEFQGHITVEYFYLKAKNDKK